MKITIFQAITVTTFTKLAVSSSGDYPLLLRSGKNIPCVQKYNNLIGQSQKYLVLYSLRE